MSDDIQDKNQHINKDKEEDSRADAESTENAPADPPAESEKPADPMLNQIPDDVFAAEENQAESETESPATTETAEPPQNSPAESSPPAAQPRPEQPAAAATPPAGDAQKKKFAFKSGGLGSKSAAKEKTTAPQKTKTDDKSNNIPRGALNAVVNRNEYYRDGYRSLMKIAFIEGIIIVSLVLVFLVYMNVHQGRDRYFATTADGRILQLVPLDQPNMSPAALMSWVSQAATEVMTFGFHDYQRRLQEASRHFTRRGWESFTTALQRSRIIESVETLQQVVTATPRSAPVLLQEGVFNGRYRWVVRLPLTVTFKSGSRTQSSNLEITITIERVPTLESPNGVGIASWIAV